jgi:hypothetical protein
MKEKSLFETNPYAKNPKLLKRMLKITTITSMAVEGAYVDIPSLTDKELKKNQSINRS